MASEYSSIARPYAEAVFSLAVEKNALDSWSETLGFMAAAVCDDNLRAIISNPSVESSKIEALLIDIGGDRLDKEAVNLLKLLVANKRLIVLPEIAGQFEALKNKKQGSIDVVVTSAFAMDADQEKMIREALEKKYASQVNLVSDVDASLLGGIHIKIGDNVIDGTVKGQLHKLANELGI